MVFSVKLLNLVSYISVHQSCKQSVCCVVLYYPAPLDTGLQLVTERKETRGE